MAGEPADLDSHAAALLPGLHAPAAGFDAPFALLDACHHRVRRTLALLERLGTHLRQRGADAAARDAAHDVLRYFSRAAPAHHEDEERHVLPLLQASGDATLQALAQRLLDDHAGIRCSWAVLGPQLQALADGLAVDADALHAAAADFVGAHDGHLEREDGLAFPAAVRLAAERPGYLAAMGEEMAARRGAPWPPAGG
jgi:hemerythrin-like domain-containing protein